MPSREEKIAQIQRLRKIDQINTLRNQQDLNKAPSELPPTELESAARGAAQGASLGFADEIAGGLGAIPTFAGKLGSADPLSGTLEKYREIRDRQRKADELAKQTNPTSYTAGNIGGAVASSFIPGLSGLTAAKAGSGLMGAAQTGAKLGAIAGLGQSQADLTKGELSDAAGDVGSGAMLGGATGAATQGLMNALSGLHPVNAAKSLAKVAFNTPEEVTQAYIDNPEAVKSALPRFELAKNFENSIGDLKRNVTEGSQTARKALQDVNFRGSDIADELKPISDELAKRAEGVWDDPKRKAAYDMLLDLQSKFNPNNVTADQAAFNAAGNADKTFTGNRVKDLIQTLQRSTDYGQGPGQFTPVDQQVTKEAAKKINDLLKNRSQDYANEMVNVAKDTDLLNRISDIDKSPQAMANLFRKMETDKYGAAQIPRQAVEEFDKRMGTDFLQQMKNSYAKETLDKSAMNGSRNVNLYSNTLGAIPGIGKVLGPILGGTVDKYGNKLTQSAVDAAVKFNQLANTQGAQTARESLQPVINAAKNADPSAILILQLLDKSNPALLRPNQQGEQLMIWTQIYGPITAATSTTAKFDLGDVTNYSFHAVFTGNDVAGTFKLQQSNDGTTWSDISGKSSSVTSSATAIQGETVANCRYVRANWAYSSGTGNLTIYFNAKQVQLDKNQPLAN